MELYTDRYNEPKSRTSLKITASFWNGIVAVVEKYKANNLFSISYPQSCDDNDGIICGLDPSLLNAAIKAHISNIKTPLSIIRDDSDELSLILGEKDDKGLPETEDVLDLIEFLYLELSDIKIIGYHSYFQHNHIRATDGNNAKRCFISDINGLFERNLLAYRINMDGKIERLLSENEIQLISSPLSTEDETLNGLIKYAFSQIRSTHIADRRLALEKLWDAFERLKTYDYPNTIKKNDSADKIISTISSASKPFDELLHAEFKALTDIGNTFMIRHSEKDKIDFSSDNQVDYLFFRMASVINLFLKYHNGRP